MAKKEFKAEKPAKLMEHKMALPNSPERDHEAEGAYHDLMRAEEHKKKPALMKRVHAHADTQLGQINSIKGLKAAANARRKELQEGHEVDDSEIDT